MKDKQLVQDGEYDFPYHYIPQFKDGFSQHLEWNWSKNYTSAIEFIIEEVNKNKEILSIADVGCGDGRVTRELSLELSHLDVTGIDYSTKAINLAKSLNPGIKFHNIDIINETMGLKFDAITLIEVFEHIPVDLCHEFVSSLSKILNEKGVVYLTVPHKNVPLSDKHEQHFDLKKLTTYYGEFFEVRDVTYIQKSPFLLKIINKLLSNSFFIITSRFLNLCAYKYYKKYCFYSEESACQRIFLRLQKK
jgi:2-polyprenyl-3-methyl-5-hydroxy-6-metoxy-1,4-benzoquinol methylase